MNTYYLNIVLESDDSLVASYDSLGELRTCWKQDAHDFLVSHAGKDYNRLGSETDWYPYFTCEDEDGDIQEISFSEIREGAA